MLPTTPVCASVGKKLPFFNSSCYYTGYWCQVLTNLWNTETTVTGNKACTVNQLHYSMWVQTADGWEKSPLQYFLSI